VCVRYRAFRFTKAFSSYIHPSAAARIGLITSAPTLAVLGHVPVSDIASIVGNKNPHPRAFNERPIMLFNIFEWFHNVLERNELVAKLEKISLD
jgi:hypothetical protein